MSVVITVAPTGPLASKSDNPYLPTQPEEIADAVASARWAGAAVAHIHPRDTQDRPTADLTTARRTMDLIAERAVRSLSSCRPVLAGQYRSGSGPRWSN